MLPLDMRNPEVQFITECGPCIGQDWRYPKELHLNKPSKPKTTFITKLINFVTNIFFIEEEVWEEEDSQEEE